MLPLGWFACIFPYEKSGSWSPVCPSVWEVPSATQRSPQRKVTYTPRWKFVLQDYNTVRARVFNSQALLEGTNLMLYSINETTLIKWFKDSNRRNEIKLLMEGLSPPQPPLTTVKFLPPAKVWPSTPGPSPLWSSQLPWCWGVRLKFDTVCMIFI